VLVAGARDVRVGELVDKGQLRTAGESRFEIQLLETRAPVGDTVASALARKSL
jgi:hypothetical protein